jgi:hypothetical protein
MSLQQQQQHPISLLIFEISKSVDAFRSFWSAYQENRETIKLNPATDQPLIDFIEDTMRIIFPPNLRIILPPDPNPSVEVSSEKRRQDMLYQRFGIPVTGKEEDFAKVAMSYKNFDKDFREIMVNIIRGIDDVTRRDFFEGDPAKLARDLNNLRNQLFYYNFNSSNRITQYWIAEFQRLIALLNDNTFMRDFGIEANDGLNQRLVALGKHKEVNVPVSEVFESHLALAQNMESFLLQIENQPNWTTQNAQALYATAAQRDIFMEIAALRKDIEPNNPDADYVALARSMVTPVRT